MTRLFRLPLVLLLSTLAIAACTDSSEPIAIGDTTARFFATLCANEVACHQQPDDATCEAQFTQGTTTSDATLTADVADGIVAYDADAFAACLAEIANPSCTYTGVHANAYACLDQAFTGTVATGGGCFLNEECIDQNCVTIIAGGCDPTDRCCASTCQPPASAPPIGTACIDNTTCSATEYCNLDPISSTGTCAAQLTTAGAACDPTASYAPCADPMACLADTDHGSTGTCKLLPAEGAACTNGGLFSCLDLRDYCDDTTLKCTPIAAVGAACSNDVPCENDATCIAGTCVADANLGDACQMPGEPGNGVRCVGFLQCTNGVCESDAVTDVGTSCH